MRKLLEELSDLWNRRHDLWDSLKQDLARLPEVAAKADRSAWLTLAAMLAVLLAIILVIVV